MKTKIISGVLCATLLLSGLVSSVSAYSMGGKSIYNSSGTKIGSCAIWNEGNCYTFGGDMSATSSSTLNINLKPRGTNLSTGADDVLIVSSPKSKSSAKYLEHSYTINSSKYYPTQAVASFKINNNSAVTCEYSKGWNWG